MQSEIFLVEELETMFAHEAANYDKKVRNQFEIAKYNPTYYDTLLTGKVFWAYVYILHDRIKSLEPKDAVRFLSLSIAQFQSHSPGHRWEAFLHKYYYAYFAPEIIEFNEEKINVKAVRNLWDTYKDHFSFFKKETEKALDELKASAFGIPPPNYQNSKASTDNFVEFINSITSFNRIYTAPLDNEMLIMSCFFNTKTEILDNLIKLNKDERYAYLNKLDHQVKTVFEFKHLPEGKINFWLKKYNLQTVNQIKFSKGELEEILSVPPMDINDRYTEEEEKERFTIQTDFLAYFAKCYKDQLLEFLSEQIKLRNTNPIVLTKSTQIPSGASLPKLKTNLTVPQLAYLFKLLNDLNPNIFDLNDKTDLSDFIANNFITKATQKNGISSKSVYNLFSDVDKSTANFWAEKLPKMLQDARKI
ncbi:MAG: hypothetical protein H7Z76_01065 [Methylotenera sp.]|nr:hypothetical protein [Flavobacterium sp.]